MNCGSTSCYPWVHLVGQVILFERRSCFLCSWELLYPHISLHFIIAVLWDTSQARERGGRFISELYAHTGRVVHVIPAEVCHRSLVVVCFPSLINNYSFILESHLTFVTRSLCSAPTMPSSIYLKPCNPNISDNEVPPTNFCFADYLPSKNTNIIAIQIGPR